MCCTRCDASLQAPAPSRPTDRGLAGPGLLAHILVSKYADHLPLYRQSEIYAREGVDLDRSTLAGWVGAASYLLSPLVDQLRKHVLADSKIHADDTPVPVLAPGTGKTKTARLWTYVRDDRPAASDVPPAVWFTYPQDRKGEQFRSRYSQPAASTKRTELGGERHMGMAQVRKIAAEIPETKFYSILIHHGVQSLARVVSQRPANLDCYSDPSVSIPLTLSHPGNRSIQNIKNIANKPAVAERVSSSCLFLDFLRLFLVRLGLQLNIVLECQAWNTH
jgi:hypothetical protein